eukprot:2666370-Amphidinium_carterae.1
MCQLSASDREQTDDDEVRYSASSDVEEGREEVGTCSLEGGVPEQRSDCPSDMVTPHQKSSPGEVPQRRSGVTGLPAVLVCQNSFLCAPQTWGYQDKHVQQVWCLTTLQWLLSRRPGDTRSASLACRENSAVSSKELRLLIRGVTLSKKMTLPGGAQRQEGGVHAGLDRELPGPGYPLFKKKKKTKKNKKKKKKEKEACDAFLERTDAAEPDDFERRGLDGRAIFTRTQRSLSETSGHRSSDTSTAQRTRMRSASSEQAELDVQGATLVSAHLSRREEYLVCCERDEEGLATV